MKIKTEEITSVIEKELESYEKKLDIEHTGNVLRVGDSIATVYGLESAMSGELLKFPGGTMGIVLNLEENSVGAVLLGNDTGIKEGDTVKCTGKIASVPVGEALLGRIINPLGLPLDGKGPVVSDTVRPIEFKAPDVVSRQPVNEPLMTGIKSIDSMIPIGRGQRELIIGDRQTGKTAIAIDTILNQKGKDVFCIYVAIGQKAASVAAVIDTLERHGAMEYTTVILADANDPASIQYIAPYAGCAIGEHFLYSRRHALCVFDDLSKHAASYRQLSLLLRRPPGREAYPGDIFYCHSRLLERAAKLSDERGGGSLTAIPIIETQAGDVSSYIPTNVISITDGQIYLEPDLFHAGFRPAINVGLSVSRVGGNAQTDAMKKCGSHLRLELAQYREIAAFAQFASDLDAATAQQLCRGEHISEILKQDQFVPMPLSHVILIVYCGTHGFLNDVPLERIKDFEKSLIEYMEKNHSDILFKIEKDKNLTDKIENTLIKAFVTFKRIFKEEEKEESSHETTVR